MTIEDKNVTIADLIFFFKNGQLHKPSFQRDKQWNVKQSGEFLNFTFSMQNILTPFLSTKHLIEMNSQTQEVFSIFDGNNRLNAIFDFENTPFKFLIDNNEDLRQFKKLLESKDGGTTIFGLVCNMSYSDSLHTVSLRGLCKKNNNKEFIEWYKKNEEIEDLLEDYFLKIQDYLKQIQFHNIKLCLKVFSNISTDQIVNIFQNINRSGVKLTEQDILKATCSMTFYDPNEIIEYHTLFHLICEYISDQNAKELLCAPLPTHNLNTFQILFALQIHLNKLFPFVIDFPGNHTDLDLVFKLFKGFFNSEMTKKNVSNMNWFIENVVKCAALLQKVHNLFFSIVTVERGIPLIPKSLNKVFIIMFYMMKNEFDLKSLTKIILYCRLCSLLNAKDEENKLLFEFKNPLPYFGSGSTIDNLINKIKRNEHHIQVPSRDDIGKLFSYLLATNNSPCDFKDKKTQYKPVVLEIIILNLYYFSRIPLAYHDSPLQLDHIIPTALKGWSAPIDINRIGNRMLINQVANSKKSNRSITSEFLQKHQLTSEYFNYISEEEYKKVVLAGEIVNHEAFEDFCIKRENIYLQGVLDYLYASN